MEISRLSTLSRTVTEPCAPLLMSRLYSPPAGTLTVVVLSFSQLVPIQPVSSQAVQRTSAGKVWMSRPLLMLTVYLVFALAPANISASGLPSTPQLSFHGQELFGHLWTTMSLKVTRPAADAGDGEARRSAAPASKHSIQ